MGVRHGSPPSLSHSDLDKFLVAGSAARPALPKPLPHVSDWSLPPQPGSLSLIVTGGAWGMHVFEIQNPKSMCFQLHNASLSQAWEELA